MLPLEGHLTPESVVVHDCPQCGAPLPAAADGAHVTCTFCGQASTLHDDSGALVREHASRRQAEALFAKLGAPPTVTQQIALALTNRWVWIVGSPFMIALFIRLGALPERAVDSVWERFRHARLAHVAPPMVGWLLVVGWPAGMLLATLVWSLFGERIDARRELQAALASKPPKTEGGPAVCRNCDAALEVPPGALGVRCAFCGADNLVQVPRSWTVNARQIDRVLRLNTTIAKKRSRESARRVAKAAAWRLPIVAVIIALVLWPMWKQRGRATWGEFLYRADTRVGVYNLAVWHAHDDPTRALRSFAACDDTKARGALQSQLSTSDSKWCEATWCTSVAMFALRRNEHLQLLGVTPGDADVHVALGDRNYTSGVAVLGDSFGDEIVGKAVTFAPGKVALDVPIALAGWYKVWLRGSPGITVEPCVVPASGP